MFDVAVDIRRGSATFGQWVGVVLSAENWNQLLIPPGFAHGFLTLEEQCEVQYKVSEPYRQEFDRAIRFDDPAIGIDWPIPPDQIVLSEKDRDAPLLAAVERLLAEWTSNISSSRARRFIGSAVCRISSQRRSGVVTSTN